MEIPVYMFTGFLEAGKTKFIQQTLEDDRFNTGEKTLLLVCEEGIEEYEPGLFSGSNVYRETIDDAGGFDTAKLTGLCKKYRIERVVVEYNGMWMLGDFFKNMPKDWSVYQQILLIDAGSFLNYNANMRSLVVDKLSYCDTVAFNRVPVGADITEFHKIVRAVSRRTDILYEYTDGEVKYDDIANPLPFDINAPVIEIQDRDYALWYRDMNENMDMYNGKTVRFKGLVAMAKPASAEYMFVGRHIMLCCENDITYSGLVCIWNRCDKFRSYDWVNVEAEIKIEKHRTYKDKGPVLYASSVEPAEPPEQQVATFY